MRQDLSNGQFQLRRDFMNSQPAKKWTEKEEPRSTKARRHIYTIDTKGEFHMSPVDGYVQPDML